MDSAKLFVINFKEKFVFKFAMGMLKFNYTKDILGLNLVKDNLKSNFVIWYFKMVSFMDSFSLKSSY